MVKIILKKLINNSYINKVKDKVEYINGKYYHVYAPYDEEYYEYGMKINDLKQGRFYYYHNKNKKDLANVFHYDKGKLNGSQLSWNIYGQLIKYENYENDILHGWQWLWGYEYNWTFYENGKETKTNDNPPPIINKEDFSVQIIDKKIPELLGNCTARILIVCLMIKWFSA